MEIREEFLTAGYVVFEKSCPWVRQSLQFAENQNIVKTRLVLLTINRNAEILSEGFNDRFSGYWMYWLFSSYLPSKRSVWENLDRGRKYRPNAVRSIHTTEVKILPYRVLNKQDEGLFRKSKCNWFVLTDILLANGDEPNSILPKFARPLYFFFSLAFWHLQKQMLLDKNSQWFCILVCNFFTSKHYRSGCRSRCENLDRGQYPFQSIKFIHLVVPSPCETEPYNN